MENPIKLHDLGVPLFLETPICSLVTNQRQHRIQRTSIQTLLLCQLNAWTELEIPRWKKTQTTAQSNHHLFCETQKKDGLEQL